MFNVGITSYINAYPFHLAFRNVIKPDAQLKFAPPTTLNCLLREDKLDAALISSLEYLKGDYHLLGPYGISAKDAIYSVNLYVKKWTSKMVCHVSKDSATSVGLLKVLAAHFWKIEIDVQPFEFNHDDPLSNAFLLIGNQALENQNFSGFERIDLAQEWKKHTGKEFVFALFAARKLGQETTLFSQKLDLALKWSETHFDEIIEAAKQFSSHSTLFLQKYYQAHTYRLSESAFEGLKLFEQLLKNV